LLQSSFNPHVGLFITLSTLLKVEASKVLLPKKARLLSSEVESFRLPMLPGVGSKRERMPS